MMINLAALLLIVSAGDAAPSGHRADTLAKEFGCDFGEGWDKNFDEFPDGWARASGPKYPHYLTIQLRRFSDEPEANRYLQVDLNGGAALVESPAVAVDARLAYVFTASLQTKGLKHDHAYLTVTFYDADGTPLASRQSDPISGNTSWRSVRLGSLRPPTTARHAKIALHVTPGEAEDLTGSVMLDNLKLTPRMRIDLDTGSRHNIFNGSDGVKITCRVSGFDAQQVRVALVLEDALENRLAAVELPIEADDAGQPAGEAATAPQPAASPSDSAPPAEKPPLRTGSAHWKPPLGTGFYRVRASLVGATHPDSDREITIAVLDGFQPPSRNEFGWSIARADKPLGANELPELLSLANVGWVKFPLWFDEHDTARGDTMSTLADRLHARRIRLVGLLADPPPDVRSQIRSTGKLTAAHIFSAEPDVWYPSVELTMTRLGMKTRWWQLGLDGDTSFVEHPQLIERLDMVKELFVRAVPDAQMGLGWSWLDPPPTPPAPSWRFLSLSADPPLSASELTAYLDDNLPRNVERWVELVPLPAGKYDEKVRAVDLVERMMACKMHGATAVFAVHPFSPKHGLMRQDATPGTLLLPWRTTVRALAGTKHAGEIQLPGGSRNDIFVRSQEAVFVLREDVPTREEVYLGAGARQIDIWGQSRALEDDDGRQVLEIGPLPTFVVGADPALVRWRQAVAFEKGQMPHVFGEAHPNALEIFNSFDDGVTGTAQLVLPEDWTTSPEQIAFQIGPGERTLEPFELVLPFNADSGKQPVRIDFDIQSPQPYRFSVFRQLEVGLGDVALNVTSRINRAGELEVEQTLTNNTAGPVTFRCHLFAPRRLRQSKVVEGRAQGDTTVVYVFPNGDDLVGQTLWIRAEEIGGSRILNKRFVAER